MFSVEICRKRTMEMWKSHISVPPEAPVCAGGAGSGRPGDSGSGGLCLPFPGMEDLPEV